MRWRYFIMIVLGVFFLPAILIPPSVHYSVTSIELPTGEVTLINRALGGFRDETVMHQISAIHRYSDDENVNCVVVANSARVDTRNKSFNWSFEVDNKNFDDPFGRSTVLASNRQDNFPPVDLMITLEIQANDQCNVEQPIEITKTLEAEIRRLWPWTLIYDAFMSV